VYLGNGWVLTAGHVQGGSPNSLQFALPVGGQDVVFTSQPGVASGLRQPDGVGTDLVVFRLNDDPRLASIPSVRIGRTPTVGTNITVVGSGYTRKSSLRAWQLDKPNDPVNSSWLEVTNLPARKDRFGYDYDLTPVVKRWGTNTTVGFAGGVPTEDVDDGAGITRMFVALFDNVANDTQVANGDSGGGVFANNRLIGISLAKGDFANSKDPALGQPADTAVYGNASYFGDVFTYVDQIASITKVHPGLDGDANLDGAVDLADFRVLYDNLNTGTRWTSGDFNLDGRVTFADYQILERNYGVTDGVASTSGEPLPMLSEVPEPGVVGAVGVGGMLLGLGRRRRR
jgi:hypothetical protein